VSALKITQEASTKVYQFVPVQDWSKSWTDEELYLKYKLSAEEIDYIENLVRPMEITLFDFTPGTSR
jgi:site-specific DNA-methyltransferase (adenine-specific)